MKQLVFSLGFVPYTRSIHLTWEHGSGNTHQGRYSGICFYYSADNEP